MLVAFRFVTGPPHAAPPQAAIPGIPHLSIVAGTGSPGAPTPGPATSSALAHPQGVALDAVGNVYIADFSARQVVKVTPSGTLSIVAGSGALGAPTPGLATSSALGYPQGVAVDTAGNVYIADGYNSEVEKVTPSGTLSVIAGTGFPGTGFPGTGFPGTGFPGTPTPGPATSSALNTPVGVAFDGAGNLYIVDASGQDVDKVTPSGTLSIVAGTGVSGAPTPGPATNSKLNFPYGVAADAAGNVYIADQGNNDVEQIAPLPPAPSEITPPQITGSATVGQTLTVTHGTWSPTPTGYAERWQDCDSTGNSCTDVPGATGPSYTLTVEDVGYTIRVQETASDAGGSSSPASATTTHAVTAPTTTTMPGPPTTTTTTTTTAAPPTTTTTTTSAPPAPGQACPAPSGSLDGLRLGPVSLGMTHAAARRALPTYAVTQNRFDRFCLTGGQTRVGYPSPRLLRTLSADQRRRVRGRVVLALTANPHYTLGQMTPGTTLASINHHLAGAQHFQIGANTWYVLPAARSTQIVKIQHGIVHEIGIADRALTRSRRDQHRLLASFR